MRHGSDEAAASTYGARVTPASSSSRQSRSATGWRGRRSARASSPARWPATATSRWRARCERRPGAPAAHAGIADYDALATAIAAHDVAVVQQLPPRMLRGCGADRRAARRGPLHADGAEALEAAPDRPLRGAGAARRGRAPRRGGAPGGRRPRLCASERQRDLWLGGLRHARRAGGGRAGRGGPFVRAGRAAGRPGRGCAPRATRGRPARAAVGGRRWGLARRPDRHPRRAPPAPTTVHLVFLGVRRPALAPADEHAATRARARPWRRSSG
jgi:hypothetical protein